MYLHDQEMVHGDLKGVRVRMPVAIPVPDFSCQGKYPDRSKWARVPGGFRVSLHRLGFHELNNLGLLCDRRYNAMDES